MEVNHFDKNTEEVEEDVAIFQQDLATLTEELNLDVEIFASYFIAILDDDFLDEASKIEAIEVILSEAGDGKTLQFASIATEILEKWKALCKARKDSTLQHRDSSIPANVLQTPALSKNLKYTKLPEYSKPSSSSSSPPIDKDIKKKMLKEFAVESVDVVSFDEAGHIIGEKKKKKPLEDNLSTEWTNDNHTQVLREAQEERARQQARLRLDILRRKEQKILQAEKKEKEKNRVAKKERRK
ncbi:hypothetical protein IE077_003969 [Cardiosporidium cionae]|uniref:CCDC43 PWI-like domain-containing protein n=1 Tax=Cardiosporidium cionae TaxID=476202 RepID=A0ABQ7J7Y7_9APIC|nr:hypothetical protein IE077_003969 [Cardiosporidium cionae]|eukprot:KAF8819805.1 hypothetical protein IE077_003969 [Cardiosporidium cionae]